MVCSFVRCRPEQHFAFAVVLALELSVSVVLYVSKVKVIICDCKESEEHKVTIAERLYVDVDDVVL